MNKSGIYKIEGPNGCIYIGSAVDLKTRESSHLLCLLKGLHHSKGLQNDYNIYGKTALLFEVVEYINLPKDKKEARRILLEREQDYLDNLFRAFEPEKIYNNRRVATSF